MALSRQIVDISGAKSLSTELREMAAQYLLYYSAFSIPMLMGSCLSVFVRNDGSPALSFVGMCAGAAANILLDWPFIFPLQTGGEPSDLLAAETTGPASLRGCSAEGRGKTLAFFPRPKRAKQNPEAAALQRFRGGTP